MGKAARARKAKAKGARRRRQGERSWAAQERRARRALERNTEAIERTTRGTPMGRPPEYRLGKSPSSYRQ